MHIYVYSNICPTLVTFFKTKACSLFINFFIFINSSACKNACYKLWLETTFLLVLSININIFKLKRENVNSNVFCFLFILKMDIQNVKELKIYIYCSKVFKYSLRINTEIQQFCILYYYSDKLFWYMEKELFCWKMKSVNASKKKMVILWSLKSRILSLCAWGKN